MRLTRIVASVFLLAVFSAGGFYAYASRDTAPSHPSLAAAALPPLVPVRDFYASPSAEWGYQASHDGKMIAWYAVDWVKTVLRVKRTGETEPFLTISGAEISDFRFHPYKNELIIATAGRLWQIDPLKPNRGHWIDITPRGFERWDVVSTPRGPEDRLAIVSNDRDPAFNDLYGVRQDGGDKQLLETNEGKTIDWGLDRRNVALLRLDRRDDEGRRVLIRQGVNDPWRTLTEVNARDVFNMLGVPAEDKHIFALSDRGRDRVALVTIDPETGEEAVVADHPKVDAELGILANNPTVPDFVRFNDGYPRFRALSRVGEVFLKLVLDGDNPVDFETIGRTLDGRFVTVARSWREQPSEYFLYDLEKGESTKISEHFLAKHKDALAETRPVSFKARDGLEIPGFLMLPRGVDPKNLPAVLVIHSGPARHEIWQFDRDYQFLANRGYAVLTVNFRGSTGYGKAFRAAGYGEMGKAMQDDIVDAARWLVEQGIADKANMAVMGAGYGGYSAALAMTRHPGVFKAAIVEAASTNLDHDIEKLSSTWDLQLGEYKRYLGGPDKGGGIEQLRERSPHAANVQGAILITAGMQDGDVVLGQSTAFEKALKAVGKDVTAVYFDGEGHNYIRWQTRVKRARLIEDFLARHLGGRTGGFDYAELEAEYPG